jgi:hypothetical protein
MPIVLRTPDKKVSLTKEELQYFIAFLDSCKVQAFSGIHFYNHARDREELYGFSLITLSEKMLNKYMNNYHQPPKKKVSFPINFAEEKSLLTMFSRVDCDPFTLTIVEKIKLSLRPAYSSTEIERK